MKGYAMFGIAIVIMVITASAAFAKSEVSVLGMRMMQVNDVFGDFVFSLKSIMTAESHAKLKLYNERAETLKERQLKWVKAKNAFVEKNGNFSINEKRDAILLFNSVHLKLIEEQKKIAGNVMLIRMKASESNDPELLMEAERISENIQMHSISLGLNFRNETATSNKNVSGISIKSGNETMNLEEAKKTVEEQTGIKATEVTSQSRGGVLFFIIKGSKKEANSSGTESFKSYEVWVNSETGNISSISIKSESKIKNSSSQASSEASGDITETITETSSDGSSSSSIARSSSSSRR